MDKQMVFKCVKRYISEAKRLRMGDCERDYSDAKKLMDDINSFLLKVVVQIDPWRNACDAIRFGSGALIVYGQYDKRKAQEIFSCGCQKTIDLLEDLRTRILGASDDDLRWDVQPTV